MPDELVLVVPPGHPWNGRHEATLDELRAEPLIVREPGSGSRQALERALEAAGRSLGDMQVIAEMGSTSAIKQAVKAGVGLSIMSSRAAEDECRHGLLGLREAQGPGGHASLLRGHPREPLALPALPRVPGVPGEPGLATTPAVPAGSDADFQATRR